MIPAPSTPTLSSELKQLIEQRNVLTTRTKSRVINALDSHIKRDREYKRLQLKNRALEEIFTSEVSYLNHLEKAMKYFKVPILESKLPLPDTLKALFDHLESVYNVNGELLNQLRIHGEDVAGAFKKVAPFFKMYSVYAYNYRHGIAALQDLSRSNHKLDGLIKRQESRPEVGMKLGALLIAPIQRLPRYRLLLKELLSHTPADHPHYLSIREAIREVELSTEHINTLISEQENVDRIIELQRTLVSSQPELIKPGRKLIREGLLTKLSKKGKKSPRYIILMTDILVVCKMTGGGGGGGGGGQFAPQETHSLRCSSVLPLEKCCLEQNASKNFFQLVCPLSAASSPLSLYSEDHRLLDSWVSAILQAIAKEQENQQTLRRKGSGRLQRKRGVVDFGNKKRKQTEECSDASPWKKNKLSAESSSNMDSSTELEELRTKHTGYLSSFKKALSNIGNTINRMWNPLYYRRDPSLESITHQ